MCQHTMRNILAYSASPSETKGKKDFKTFSMPFLEILMNAPKFYDKHSSLLCLSIRDKREKSVL
jgi:hypothetical protein